MQFDGPTLLEVIARTTRPIKVLNRLGGEEGEVDALRAARICRTGGYVGVGHMKRVRFLRPLGSAYASPMAQSNYTTRRVRNDQGVIIAPRPMVEHNPVRR